MAAATHTVNLGEGDTMLLASFLIPGKENAIYRAINGLAGPGANVVHNGNAKVHVSGQTSAGELVCCYNIARPSNVPPIHGEARHLRANTELAAHRRRRHRSLRRRTASLGEEGVLTVVVLLGPDTGQLTEEPDVLARGFEHDASTFQPLTPVLEKALGDVAEVGALEQLIVRETQNWTRRTFRRHPVVIPVVTDA